MSSRKSLQSPVKFYYHSRESGVSQQIASQRYIPNVSRGSLMPDNKKTKYEDDINNLIQLSKKNSIIAF